MYLFNVLIFILFSLNLCAMDAPASSDETGSKEPDLKLIIIDKKKKEQERMVYTSALMDSIYFKNNLIVSDDNFMEYKIKVLDVDVFNEFIDFLHNEPFHISKSSYLPMLLMQENLKIPVLNKVFIGFIQDEQNMRGFSAEQITNILIHTHDSDTEFGLKISRILLVYICNNNGRSYNCNGYELLKYLRDHKHIAISVSRAIKGDIIQPSTELEPKRYQEGNVRRAQKIIDMEAPRGSVLELRNITLSDVREIKDILKTKHKTLIKITARPSAEDERFFIEITAVWSEHHYFLQRK